MSRTSAAGTGAVRKPFLELAGATVLEQALRPFAAAKCVFEIVIVGAKGDLARLAEIASGSGAAARFAGCVEGGAERTDSVRCGVRAVAADAEVILVHDVARPLVRVERIDAAARVAHRDGAALLAVPVRDTIKAAPDGRRVEQTLDRSRLFAAQTPQAFEARRFREILERAEQDGFAPTDDSALWERYVGPVTIVPDDPDNIKLTTPADLALATAILRARAEDPQ